MANKKLIALLVAISAIASISARCYRDGSCDDRGVVRRTSDAAEGAVEGTGRVAGRAVEETGGFLGRVFGKPRRERREERRMNRQQQSEDDGDDIDYIEE